MLSLNGKNIKSELKKTFLLFTLLLVKFCLVAFTSKRNIPFIYFIFYFPKDLCKLTIVKYIFLKQLTDNFS